MQPRLVRAPPLLVWSEPACNMRTPAALRPRATPSQLDPTPPAFRSHIMSSLSEEARQREELYSENGRAGRAQPAMHAQERGQAGDQIVEGR